LWKAVVLVNDVQWDRREGSQKSYLSGEMAENCGRYKMRFRNKAIILGLSPNFIEILNIA